MPSFCGKIYEKNYHRIFGSPASCLRQLFKMEVQEERAGKLASCTLHFFL